MADKPGVTGVGLVKRRDFATYVIDFFQRGEQLFAFYRHNYARAVSQSGYTLPMKFITTLTASVVGMGLFATAFAETAPAKNPIKFELPQVGSSASQPAAAAPALVAPAVPAVKYTQAQLMEAYGFLQAAQSHLADLEFTAADVDAMALGMKMALSNETPPFANDGKNVTAQLQEVLGKKKMTLLGKIRDTNIAESAVFFAKLKDNKAVQILPSGLGIEVIKAANGATPKLGQLVKFHFTLTNLGGQVMQSTAGRDPVESIINEGSDMPGMIEGLQKIPVGGKYKLYLPYQIAYGEQGGEGVPPASSLIFEIEVLEVKDAPKEVAPAGK